MPHHRTIHQLKKKTKHKKKERKSKQEAGLGHSSHWETISFPILNKPFSGFLHKNAELNTRNCACQTEGSQTEPL